MLRTRLLQPLAPYLLAALLATPLAHAQGGPQMSRGMMDNTGPHRMMWGMEENDPMSCPMSGSGPWLQTYPWRLNLNETQRRRAEEIFDKARTRTRANHEQMLAAQARLREALNKPKRDRNEIMNAWREVESLRLRHFEYNLDAQLEFDQLTGK